MRCAQRELTGPGSTSSSLEEASGSGSCTSAALAAVAVPACCVLGAPGSRPAPHSNHGRHASWTHECGAGGHWKHECGAGGHKISGRPVSRAPAMQAAPLWAYLPCALHWAGCPQQRLGRQQAHGVHAVRCPACLQGMQNAQRAQRKSPRKHTAYAACAHRRCARPSRPTCSGCASAGDEACWAPARLRCQLSWHAWALTRPLPWPATPATLYNREHDACLLRTTRTHSWRCQSSC